MSRRLFWQLCLIIVAGVVAFFWLIDLATSQTEEGMSFIDIEHRQQIIAWGQEAERLYFSQDTTALNEWINKLRETEKTSVSIARTNLENIAGDKLPDLYYHGYLLGRNVDWKIHLYFERNPIMEVPFSNGQTGFLIQLPERMRPGSYFEYTWVVLQIVLPMTLLGLLTIVLYHHIMNPLHKLQLATRSFSQGNFDVRVRQLLGNRRDEFSELADTFDQMAARIGQQVTGQRLLISDLSHELRTPLTRLDISMQSLKEGKDMQTHLSRIQRESTHIRKLVDDSLTLAWLENEQPKLQQESLDLVDLLDVLIDDAQFEFPDRVFNVKLPSNAEIHKSNHRSLGQALENIIRNALRFTPAGKVVSISIEALAEQYIIRISDQGPGVADKYLKAIFKPFFRAHSSKTATSNSFGLGLALANRQIVAVAGHVYAVNLPSGGLMMVISLPINAQKH